MKTNEIDVFIGFVIFLISLSFYSCSASNKVKKHNFEILSLKEYYEGEGAIIQSNNPQYFTGRINIKKMTPTTKQIKEAENILRKDLLNYYYKLLNDGYFYFSDEIPESKADSVKRFTEAINNENEINKKYYRYYMGYINNKNENVIMIVLFNFSSKKSRQVFANWKDEYISGTGNFFEENTRHYFINLTKKMIENKND